MKVSHLHTVCLLHIADSKAQNCLPLPYLLSKLPK